MNSFKLNLSNLISFLWHNNIYKITHSHPITLNGIWRSTSLKDIISSNFIEQNNSEFWASSQKPLCDKLKHLAFWTWQTWTSKAKHNSYLLFVHKSLHGTCLVLPGNSGKAEKPTPTSVLHKAISKQENSCWFRIWDHYVETHSFSILSVSLFILWNNFWSNTFQVTHSPSKWL